MTHPLSENYAIVPIALEHVSGFWAALDSVARELAWLAFFEAPALPLTQAYVEQNLRTGRPHVVALCGEEVVGWADIADPGRPVFSHAGTLGMGVVAAHRGRGLGSALLDAALAQARAIGLRRVELTVRAHNLTAIALYRRAGFRLEGTHPRGVLVDGRYETYHSMGLWLADAGA